MERSHKTIFLIDDDQGIRKSIGLLLERAGFSVIVAASGDEGLEIIEQKKIGVDCILLDIRMPGRKGSDILPILHKMVPNVPIVMLTALTELETAVDTMKKGAFDYLTKPVRKIQLIETVKKAIQYRHVLLENERLLRENKEYQCGLERKVEERTQELFLAYEKLKNTNLETVRVLAETIEAKDPYTRGHCNRVRVLSGKLYELVDPDKNRITDLQYAALLHDIGKIGISETILHKTGPLNREETNLIRNHPLIGERILQTVDFFSPCLTIICHHHEWFNGNGYPDGIAGEEVDLLARIVSITDAYDAMTSDRPYRAALPAQIACRELEASKGKQFDPELVDLFIREKVYVNGIVSGSTQI